MRKKLLIISHTEHYKKGGNYVGWGSTITEINYLSQFWEEVVHIACLHDKEAPGSSLPYTSSNIRFVDIPPFGGDRLLDKLSIIFIITGILKKISMELNDVTEVQLRLPTGIGVFLLPWFTIRKRSFTFWVKYAGNWNQQRPPIGYAFQRWWLKNNFARCNVTINGSWPNQPKHCLSFENPCLNDGEILKGKELIKIKSFKLPYSFIFIGRLEDAKGVMRILDALKYIPNDYVKDVHFIGDSKKKELYENIARQMKIPIFFHNFLPRSAVHDLLQKADFLLLPSTASEGFPKVIAEGACYGVIPIVSNVASIPHYVNRHNGFLWKTDTSFLESLYQILQLESGHFSKISVELSPLASRFTFAEYFSKLEKEVLLNERETRDIQ